MRACNESLEEGKRYLEDRSFNSDNDRLPVNRTFVIYYNARVDIIFFGENTCIATTISLSSETPGIADKPIPRDAVMCSPRMENCCDHDDADYGVVGGVYFMHFLHGFSKDVTNHDFRYAGCPGLQAVHFIVKSKLWQVAPGEIGSDTGLRHASTKGFTPEKRTIKQRLGRESMRVNDSFGIGGV
ncbi:hypothetical protein BKA65DRAFT_65063 [Rhexocercosporidium sp. MPI-PUGE-AT-0058]|nr:hypothetical protein BKA65DRAFT_65063 [Rhexocercosporidium sp. MPI-PUGE-AT-0058]